MYTAWEIQAKRLGVATGTARYSRAKQALGRLPLDNDEEIEKLKDTEGMTQLRGRTNVDAGKVRVCLEQRVVVVNHFDPTKIPRGIVLPSVLVLHGAHAKLCNIDANHRRIRAERYYMGTVLIEKEAGSYSASLWEHVELRKVHPEWYEEMLVHSQPSGVVDQIIYMWMLEDLAQRFPQGIEIRDLLGVCLSDAAKGAARVCGWVKKHVSPGMTPCGQWTDTTGARIQKLGSEEEKDKIRLEKKEEHRSLGLPGVPSYEAGAKEIMRIALAGHRKLSRITKIMRS